MGTIQAQQQPPIRTAGIIHPLAIRDQATLIPAQVQQWIPVRASPRQAGHIERQNNPDFAQRHLGQEVFKASAVGGTGGGGAEIAIDDGDGRGGPTQLQRARLQRLLQPQALLRAERLVRGGLADINDRLARQVLRRDEFGGSPGSPREGSC